MDSEGGSLHHAHNLQHHHKHHHTRHIRHRHISSGEDGIEEEELDPRIQIELEKLNRATEEINRLELELDDARASFRQVLSDSSQRLNGLAKKLGTCVDKARPYYDARMKLKEAHLESQKAALRFERACSMHEAAKEMVQLAEEGYKRREEDLDPTWQEMLNHATMKVNDAERERIESEDHHQSTTLNFKKREEEVQKLQRDLKRAITKSKPYFEMKAKFNQVMEDHKRNVSRLEEDVASTKALYSEALRNLEAISDDIHRQRLERRQKLQLGIRGAGVGAESPSPPPSWDKGINIEGSASHMYGSDEECPDDRTRNRASKRRWKEQGIVGHDHPLCHQTSVCDDHDIDTNSLKSDPLNLVVFKTDSPQQHLHDSSPYGVNNFQPPSVIHSDARCARTPSYRQAVERGCDESNERSDREAVNGTHGNEDNSQILLSSMSPRSIRRREVEAMQSSLSRAQEWVNKSPIPQQRRFIKSKSLIDASSPPASLNSDLGSKSSSTPPPPSTSSLNADNNRLVASSATQREDYLNQSWPGSQLKHHHHNHLQHQPHFQYPPNTTTISDKDVTKQIQPHLQLLPSSSSPTTSSIPLNYSKSSPRSVSTSDQSSPISGSPSGKSPKLQGLILRVDAAGILSSPSPTAAGSHNQNNPVIISTKTPAVGMFAQQPHISSSSPSFTPPTDVTATREGFKAPSDSSLLPSSMNTTTATLNTQYSSTSPPQPTLIPNTKASSSALGGFKLSSYSSKTAPPSAFHLPSPTRNRNIPPSLRQIVSPTPPSPSGDRVSILSGRSDSSKGGLLRPPSDSSDTESIASTGPMLDDDQVEFLTMDFSEQSITSVNQQNHVEDGDFINDDSTRLQRGNWSRLSLPPRLSYLGGYLERARQMAQVGGITSVDSDDKQDDDDSGENRNDDTDDLSPQVDESENLRECEDEWSENQEDITVSEKNDTNGKKDEVGGEKGETTECVRNDSLEEGGENDISVNIKIHIEECVKEDTEKDFEGKEKEDGLLGEGKEGGRDELRNLENVDLEENERKADIDENTAEFDTKATIIMSSGGNIEIIDNEGGSTEL